MGEKEEKKLFRKKSLDRLNSPEQLNDYLRVTTPSVWLIFIAVTILLVGIVVWACFAEIESYAEGSAAAKDGVLTITVNKDDQAAKVRVGMTVMVGEIKSEVISVGENEHGQTIAAAKASIPDGLYEAKIVYNRTQIIKLLFN